MGVLERNPSHYSSCEQEKGELPMTFLSQEEEEAYDWVLQADQQDEQSSSVMDDNDIEIDYHTDCEKSERESRTIYKIEKVEFLASEDRHLTGSLNGSNASDRAEGKEKDKEREVEMSDAVIFGRLFRQIAVDSSKERLLKQTIGRGKDRGRRCNSSSSRVSRDDSANSKRMKNAKRSSEQTDANDSATNSDSNSSCSQEGQDQRKEHDDASLSSRKRKVRSGQGGGNQSSCPPFSFAASSV